MDSSLLSCLAIKELPLSKLKFLCDRMCLIKVFGPWELIAKFWKIGYSCYIEVCSVASSITFESFS